MAKIRKSGEVRKIQATYNANLRIRQAERLFKKFMRGVEPVGPWTERFREGRAWVSGSHFHRGVLHVVGRMCKINPVNL